MEDDDEFGDLYTDVLRTFPSSSSSAPRPPHTEAPPSRPIDIDLQSDVDAPSAALDSNFTGSEAGNTDSSRLSDSKPEAVAGPASKIWESPSAAAEVSAIRVLHTADLNLAVEEEEDAPLQDQKGANKLNVIGADKDGDFDTIEHNLSAADQLNGSMEDLDSEPIIPGLATPPLSNPASDVGPAADFGSSKCDGIGGEGDDWDSDSEDDLQIVLNDNNHGPMGMETNGLMVAANDDDEDEEPLVIVADNDVGHQPAEEQDWGEDQGQPSDGKEIADPSKANGGLVAAPKTGYSNYGYHPFHSQFKYVRPGAAPLPGGPSVSSGGVIGHIRPSVNTNNIVGRGRGDWRLPGMKGPPLQKGFHPGFWGVQGRGLEFTLPSHKTVFDVDVDSFEEKPWKHPGVDISDFFNFGLNEDSWKDYCKQLEHMRLESTMQSKIRVYEGGRAEQEYDPDLPPELAAATGIHDTAENAVFSKVQGEVGESAKVSERLRPPLPTGRAIQVETGCGERLPSVDTRPPRIRDSDAVIEIVLQDSMEEGCAGDDASEYRADESPRGDDRVELDEDGIQDEDEYFDEYSRGYRHMDEGVTGERSPMVNSLHDEERDKSTPQREPGDDPGLGGHASTEDAGSPARRWITGKLCERSPHMSSGDSALEGRALDHHQEDSNDSTEGKPSLESSFDPAAEDIEVPSLEGQHVPENDVVADRRPAKLKGDINVVSSDTTPKDKDRLHCSRQQKLSSRVEPLGIKEVDDGGDFKTPKGSDTSKAMGSSRDHSKWQEGAEEKVEKDGRFTNMEDLKKNRGESGHDSRRKDHNGRAKLERSYMSIRGREECHSHKDWDGSAVNDFHLKGDGTDWRKDKDFHMKGEGTDWQKRDEEPHSRRIRADDARKQEHADVMPSGDRVKVRDIDRSDKENSRKPSDDGSWRVHHEKEARLRYRDKDDSLKIRHDILDDRHIKRRKDDEHFRRDHMEKEEIMLGRGESSSTRRKRDRDDVSTQCRKDDQPRIRDMDDHSNARAKDELWMHREKGEQQRERDELYRTKQSYEEHLSRREREDGRVPNRYHRNVDEKKWAGHSHGREEYNGHDKDTGRYGEQLNRRDRVEDESGMQYRGKEDVYPRGKQFGNEVKRSRQEKPNVRNDRAVHASVSHRAHEKLKDVTKSARESQGHGTPGSSKRDRGEKGVANEMVDVKRTGEKAEAKHDTVNNIARERRDVSSDDEQPESKRGRSKLERWTSHKERDYEINSRSSSLKIKDINRDKSAGSFSGSSAGAVEESARRVDTMDNTRSSIGQRDGGGLEGKDADVKCTVDGHLDTFEKLKRRSERFKVPLTSDKDAAAVKKLESEASPSFQNDGPANSFVKPERPARKRRWISS